MVGSAEAQPPSSAIRSDNSILLTHGGICGCANIHEPPACCCGPKAALDVDRAREIERQTPLKEGSYIYFGRLQLIVDVVTANRAPRICSRATLIHKANANQQFYGNKENHSCLGAVTTPGLSYSASHGRELKIKLA